MYKANKKEMINALTSYTLPIGIGLLLLILDMFAIIKAAHEYLIGGVFALFIFAVIQYFVKKCVGIIKYLKKIDYLCDNAKLIKDLKYEVDTSNIGFINMQDSIKRPYVKYTLKDGKQVQLFSINNIDEETLKNNPTIDLLIDEKNPSNYYLDFNIQINGHKS